MANPTTKVKISRIEGFENITSKIGEYVITDLEQPKAGYISVAEEQILNKTDWPDLYATGAYEDGLEEGTFIVPATSSPVSNKYVYLVGKILSSNTAYFNEGHGASLTFGNADLDSNHTLTFNHGIAHINPIIQLMDSYGTQVNAHHISNSVGVSKIGFGREIQGVWKVVAYG